MSQNDENRNTLNAAESIALYGPEAYTDTQILATLLEAGSPAEALDLLSKVGTLQALVAKGPLELLALGMSARDAARIGVLNEIQRRSSRNIGACLATPRQAAAYLLPKAAGLEVERFGLICLDAKVRVVADRLISQGIASGTLVRPREVYQEALRNGAISILVWHNHPSGDATPSREDQELTHRLYQAGMILGIPLADHIILGRECFHSFRAAEGWMGQPNEGTNLA